MGTYHNVTTMPYHIIIASYIISATFFMYSSIYKHNKHSKEKYIIFNSRSSFLFLSGGHLLSGFDLMSSHFSVTSQHCFTYILRCNSSKNIHIHVYVQHKQTIMSYINKLFAFLYYVLFGFIPKYIYAM